MNQAFYDKKQTGHWSALTGQFKKAFPDVAWHIREWEIFFEIETVLHLHALLIPNGDGVQVPAPEDSWSLVSGYTIEGINADDEARRKCLVLRSSLRYVRTASAWKLWLRWYQRDAGKPMRLFRFHCTVEGTATFQEEHFGVAFHRERLEAYKQLYQLQPAVPESDDGQPIAEAGTYSFTVDKASYSVEITEAFAKKGSIQPPRRSLPDRTLPRALITIDLGTDLRTIAEELDAHEAEHGLVPGNWLARWETLRFMLPESMQLECRFTIDGIFHLAGMLGAGKSTLIYLMVYYLVTRYGLHITVVMNTVVEMIRFAVWLRRLGLTATPALGRHRRAEHAQKYGLANAEALDPRVIFQSNQNAETDYPLNWLVAPCAISGMQEQPIPAGKEPCYQLMDVTGKKHRCPLLTTCPVHQPARDLTESQVWVVNPYSFLYSRAPEGIGTGNHRLLEAIYRLSDLVIIDEADRVQVQWDDAFAPTRQLVGGDDSFLDALHRNLGQRSLSVGRFGRRRSARAQFHRLTNNDDRAHTLSNHLFRLIAKAPKVARWLRSKQLTNFMLYRALTERLVKLLPKDIPEPDQEKLREFLKNEFRAYWSQPFRNRTTFLGQWMREIGDPDIPEKDHRRKLAQWLSNLMGWELPLRAKRLTALNLLDFAVTFTALLKTASDLTYLAVLLDDELGDLGDESYTVPDMITSLVPDPPLGAMLGVRHIGYAGAANLGMFNLLRNSGIGRWLLLNFPGLYWDQMGETGPHLLLTSATSWLPGSAQFHLATPPSAILLPPDEKSSGAIELLVRPIRKISGAGKRRESNLRAMVRDLIKPGKHSLSDLQRELDYWKERDQNRKILLVVMSYEQVGWVRDELSRNEAWAGRIRSVIPDDLPNEDEDMLRARQVEQFRDTSADILIAPLLAIQRGFNILDEDDGALLGSVYFLVRPYPPPDDLKPQLLSLNAWTMRQLHEDGRRISPKFAEYGIGAVKELRRLAYAEWNRRLRTHGGLDAMDADIYAEFLRDQFVAVWQTIGRLLRGGRSARVYFSDKAFVPGEGHRNMLHDWYTMLETMATQPDEIDQFLAQWLYGRARQAFQDAVKKGEIR